MPTPITSTWRHLKLVALVASLAPVATYSSVAVGQVITDGPKEMQGVGIVEQRGEQIPLDLEFRDHDGLPLTLGKIINGEKPVLLSLNYSDCPMLCGQQLNGLVDTLVEMEWDTGDEFEVVSVSINPRERPERAKQTHRRYTQEYGRPGAADGWHFLVGDQDEITALADAVGFHYNFIPDTGEFAHAAALIVVTPDGVVSRYLNGVINEPKTVRLSLVEASEGKIGSAFDQLFLTCFVYDHTKGRYGPQAVRIMQFGAAVTVVVLGLSLAPFWLRRRRAAQANTADQLSLLNNPNENS